MRKPLLLNLSKRAMPPKSHHLHSHPERRKIFASTDAGMWHEDGIVSSWIVADPALVLEVLKRPKSAMPDWFSFMEKSEKALGHKLENLRQASRYIPLLLNDKDHGALRKALAIYLAERLKVLEPRLAEHMATLISPLGRPGILDLADNVARPIVRMVGEVLIDGPLPPGFDEMSLFEVFPSIRSPAKSRRVDGEFGVVFEHLKTASRTEMVLACKICCLIFGVDTLVMLIVENILACWKEGGDGNLPAFPLETGVPITNRMPDHVWTIGGHDVAPGEILRLQLQPLGYSEKPQHNAAIFGAGIHVCVGKQVSLRVWHHLREAFNSIAPRARILDYVLKPSAAICLYKTVKIEVLP
jgi:hypothetical protein